jgi:nucleoid-associated protein YgaU
MAVTPLKAVLFAGGGIVAAAAVAYVSGALDPYFKPQPPAEVAALNPPPGKPENPAEVSPGTGVHDVTPPAGGKDSKPTTEASVPSGTDAMKPAAPAAGATPAKKPEQGAAPAVAAGPVLPTFDVVRVEGDGSLVVAGNAAPNARVELLNGAAVIGSTTAGPDGAFAIVLDDPLKPGDYQLLLRSTTPDNTVSNSQQTAVVSVPDKPGGQVLAMVEEAGKASELMAVPAPAVQPGQPAAPSAADAPEAGSAPAPEAAKQSPAAGAQTGDTPAQTAAAPAEPKPAIVQPAIPGAPKIAVEAVEIDGSKIFVAGTADPGRKVRAYANEILLGDATTSPDGHFLVEATHDLPVGTYTVRVDALDAGAAKVVARATVPFEREPGASVAAVAPPAPGGAAAPEGGASQAADTAPANPSAGTSGAPTQAGSTDNGTPVAGVAPSAGQSAPAASEPQKQPEVAAAQPSDGVPETVSPKLEHADGAVIIRRRDTLWQISRRVYGHGVRYSTIYLANQDQISDPDRIWPGQVFRVPGTSKEGEAADLKALGDQATAPPTKTE